MLKKSLLFSAALLTLSLVGEATYSPVSASTITVKDTAQLETVVQEADLGNEEWLIAQTNKQLAPKKVGKDVTFKDLSRITRLDKDGYYGDGIIPKEITRFTNLKLLNLKYVIGQIPKEIGQLKKLENFYIQSSKELGGEIPKEITSISTLKMIYFSETNLTGNLPKGIGDMPSLSQLIIQDSELSGALPEEIFNLPELTHLLLPRNKFYGEIPESISHLTYLRFLNLDNNHFTGKIPTSIKRLANLRYITLSNNDLVGIIPQEVYDLPNVSLLEIKNNQVTLNSNENPLINGHKVDYSHTFVNGNGLKLSGTQKIDLEPGTKSFKPFDPNAPGYLTLHDGKGNMLLPGHTYTFKNMKTDEILYSGPYDENVSIPIDLRTNIFDLILDEAPGNSSNVLTVRIYA